jgi:hypothetical protein
MENFPKKICLNHTAAIQEFKNLKTHFEKDKWPLSYASIKENLVLDVTRIDFCQLVMGMVAELGLELDFDPIKGLMICEPVKKKKTSKRVTAHKQVTKPVSPKNKRVTK